MIPAPSALTLADVSVAYHGHRVLWDVNLTLPPGTICGLVGANGAGKSTLFKALLGFVPLATGRVSLLGQTPAQARRAALVAYVPQLEEVDWHFPVSVQDVVMMGRYGHMNLLRRPRAHDRALVAQALHRVSLTGLEHRQIGTLSGGQKKRVFIARALAQQARIILLDEPFAAVDAQTEQTVSDLLRELRATAHTVLLSTHDLVSVEKLCDHVVLLKGQMLAFGPTAQVYTRANLHRAMGGNLPSWDLPEALPAGVGDV